MAEPGHDEVLWCRPKDDQKMIVFGVSYSTTKEGFRDYFAGFGEVLECELMFNREGRSRGFGFVLFKDDAVNKSVLTTQHLLDGRNLDVKLRDSQNHGRDRGGFGSAGGGFGGRPDDRPAASRTKIFIGRLNDDVQQDDLREYFEQFGTITDVFMPTNHSTGKTKNCGFVEFASPESASAAVAETRHVVKGTEATVQAAEPKEARGGRGGYGGRGSDGGPGGMGFGMDRFGGGFERDRYGGDRYERFGGPRDGRDRGFDRDDRRYDDRGMMGMGGRGDEMMGRGMGGFGGMGGMDEMWGMGGREMWMMYDRLREMYERGGGGMDGGFPPFMDGGGMGGGGMGGGGGWGGPGGGGGGGMGGGGMGGGGGRGGARARVMVEGLPRGTQWQGLKDMFKQFGTLRADVSPDGVGCVTFDDPAAARSAVGSMNGMRVENSVLRVYAE